MKQISIKIISQFRVLCTSIPDRIHDIIANIIIVSVPAEKQIGSSHRMSHLDLVPRIVHHGYDSCSLAPSLPLYVESVQEGVPFANPPIVSKKSIIRICFPLNADEM